MKRLLFTLPISDMKEVNDKYSAKVPKPLNTQFPERATKEDAVTSYMERSKTKKKATLFPSSKFNFTLYLQLLLHRRQLFVVFNTAMGAGGSSRLPNKL